ncbi:hypothetical protein STRIP9103_07316 [Streptomyces ipomoeae 91-03]|uniref:Uncharacterized protein n=1 Tax=Streptomyces ipomoeae 91-03 TaxID=698759 RepID=L1L4T1_9ACTN|nr:hypothetical protein STRIP9103_07316 [Streptomyces ipomoeae 91-03]
MLETPLALFGDTSRAYTCHPPRPTHRPRRSTARPARR